MDLKFLLNVQYWYELLNKILLFYIWNILFIFKVDEEQTPLVFTIVENYLRKKRNQNENFAIKPLVEQRIIIK